MCLSVFSGFQWVSLQNLLALTKIIFSSPNRIKCPDGRISVFASDSLLAVRSNSPFHTFWWRANCKLHHAFPSSLGRNLARRRARPGMHDAVFQIFNLDHGWLHTRFATDQLSHNIVRCVIRLYERRSVNKKPHVDRRNVVIRIVF